MSRSAWGEVVGEPYTEEHLVQEVQRVLLPGDAVFVWAVRAARQAVTRLIICMPDAELWSFVRPDRAEHLTLLVGQHPELQELLLGWAMDFYTGLALDQMLRGGRG